MDNMIEKPQINREYPYEYLEKYYGEENIHDSGEFEIGKHNLHCISKADGEEHYFVLTGYTTQGIYRRVT